MPWVDKIITSTEGSESPERFYYWSALAAISAVVRKNVYLDRFRYKLYPNIFVFFVAKSGLRKGLPVTLCRDLVQEVHCTRIVMGRNSMPQVIKDLGKAYSTANGHVVKDAHALLVSGELAAFFIKDPDALTILTDIYDTHAYEKEWKNSLKGTGVDVLKSPCITLLGATNEEHFSDAVPPNAIGGGFIARTFIIFEDKKRCINSLMDEPDNLINIPDLVCYLKEIAKVKGQFKMTGPARVKYDKWYTQFCEQDHNDPTGTLERVHDSILKVGMLVSLSESLELVMTERHVEEALDVSLVCTGGMRRVTMGHGASTFAAGTRLVLQELLKRPDHQASRLQLLSRYWGQFDAFDLDRIAETLESSGAVTVQRAGKNTYYKLKPSIVEQYLGFKKEIN